MSTCRDSLVSQVSPATRLKGSSSSYLLVMADISAILAFASQSKLHVEMSGMFLLDFYAHLAIWLLQPNRTRCEMAAFSFCYRLAGTYVRRASVMNCRNSRINQDTSCRTNNEASGLFAKR